MLDTFLVPAKTVVTATGDGAALDLGPAPNRVFLLSLTITNIVEQEALEVSVYTSLDGTAWSAKPSVSFGQKFYCGEHPLLLDLTAQPDVHFVRAHWETLRWGRGPEAPMFEFGVALKEVPPEVLVEARSEARARA
jgi:hypothetical protein